jgi:hypothetical protein
VSFGVRQVVGIDTSPIRQRHCLVGRAAKLTEIKADERTWITKAVFDYGDAPVKISPDQSTPIWTEYAWTERGTSRTTAPPVGGGCRPESRRRGLSR